MFYIFLKKAFFSLLFALFFLFITLSFALPMLVEGKISGSIIGLSFFLFLAYLGLSDAHEIYIESNKEHTKKITKQNITHYLFPSALKQKIVAHYPHLEDKQVEEILCALKRYFLLYLEGGEKVSWGEAILKKGQYKNCFIPHKEKEIMPSMAVDFAWKSFSNMKEEYRQFCKIVLGCHLDYSLTCPVNTTINTQKLVYWHSYKNNDSAEMFTATWLMNCKAERIDPVFPARLPSLFALDAKLNIPSGLCYTLNDRPYEKYIDIHDAPTPEMLSEEIKQRLSAVNEHHSGRDKSKQLDYLSKKLSFYLNHANYCQCFQKEELAPLFKTLFNNNELVTHLLGDYALLVEQQELTESNAASPPAPSSDVGCCCCGASV